MDAVATMLMWLKCSDCGLNNVDVPSWLITCKVHSHHTLRIRNHRHLYFVTCWSACLAMALLYYLIVWLYLHSVSLQFSRISSTIAPISSFIWTITATGIWWWGEGKGQCSCDVKATVIFMPRASAANISWPLSIHWGGWTLSPTSNCISLKYSYRIQNTSISDIYSSSSKLPLTCSDEGL